MTLSSLVSGRRYRCLKVLGAGGFGKAYLANVTGRGAKSLPPRVCLKLTRDQSSWHVEAYFGQLLKGERCAIAVYEAFPVRRRVKGMLRQEFALVTELADHGNLLDFLGARGIGLPERKALREFRGLLRVVGRLHVQGAMHRDITPGNVLVCHRARLKLGDFGIVKQGRGRGRVNASAFAPWFAPPEVRNRERPHWMPADDVYQLGQVLALLVSGETTRPLMRREVAQLACSTATRRIIQRCIGPRSTRFQTAREVLDAVDLGIARLPKARFGSLAGRTVVITGRLSIPRREAVALLTRAGARVQARVSSTTDVLIRGVDCEGQPYGEAGGRKVVAADAAWARGQHIVELDEARLRRLVKGWPGQLAKAGPRVGANSTSPLTR